LDVDGINSYYIGRHFVRNGDRPQKFCRVFDPMAEFYWLNKELFDVAGVNVADSVTMKGCFKSNKLSIQRTMVPDTDSIMSGLPDMSKVKLFSKAIRTCIRKLKIVTLAKCTKDDMLSTSFNPKTFPGFHLYEYFDHKNKRDAACNALEIANIRWDKISNAAISNSKLSRNDIFPNSFVVGARNKRENDFVDFDYLSSRAVHMPEFHTELNSSVWIEQINKHLKINASGPLYIGNSLVRYERLVKDLGSNKNTIEGDWKRFDSRLYITNIIIGLSILRLFYDLDDEEIDYHFLAIFDTIGIKDYITPGGYLYRMIHGLPSGVCSTTILGSVINLVNLLYCSEGFPSKDIRYIVGGDDFLVSISDSINSSEIIDRMKERSTEIGQLFKFLEVKQLSSSNILERPCFFKYTIDRNEPVVYPTALLERVFIPWNKDYRTNSAIIEFLYCLLPSLGSPRSFHIPYYMFYSSMFFKLTDRIKPVSEIFELHKMFYKRTMSGERFFLKRDIINFLSFSKILDVSTSTVNKRLIDKFCIRQRFKLLKVKFNASAQLSAQD
jgi:hypothetical protein